MQKRTYKLLAVGSFFARHFVAALVSIIVPVILTVLAYFALFAIALVTNSGMGDLFALPFWSLFVLATSISYTIFLLFPSVFIAELVSRRFGKYKHPVQIPFSTITLGLLLFLIAFVARIVSPSAQQPGLAWLKSPFIAFLLLLIPLGLYWWVMKFAELGLFLPTWLFRKLKSIVT